MRKRGEGWLWRRGCLADWMDECVSPGICARRTDTWLRDRLAGLNELSIEDMEMYQSS